MKQCKHMKNSVDPSTIKVLDDLQVREKMDYEYVRELQDAMDEIQDDQDICELRILDCGEAKGELYCLDGHHRRLAAIAAGKRVWVRAWDVPREDWRAIGIKRNCANGRRLSKTELHSCVMDWFRSHPEMSDVSAAAELGIPRSTIGDIRRQCAESGTLKLSETVTGADGKEYPRERKRTEKSTAADTSEGSEPFQGWKMKCSACGCSITEEECWSDASDVVTEGMEMDGKPTRIWCNADCRDEWKSKQLDKAGTKILKDAGLDKDGRGADDGPAPDTVPEERSPSNTGCVVPAPPVTASKDEPKLLPCPWCGNIPEVTHMSGDYRIVCRTGSCVVHPYTTSATRLDILVELWNTRKG